MEASRAERGWRAFGLVCLRVVGIALGVAPIPVPRTCSGGPHTCVVSTRRVPASISGNRDGKVRIVGFAVLALGDRKWHLNHGQMANIRGVRGALGTGYNRGDGNRRASRNGRVCLSPPKTPYRFDSQFFRRCTERERSGRAPTRRGRASRRRSRRQTRERARGVGLRS